MKGECAILEDVISLICKSVKSGALKIYNSSKTVKTTIFAGLSIIAILLSFTFTGARIAYKVNYSGNMIATVSRKQQFSDALQLVADKVSGKGVESAVFEPKFNIAIVLNTDINSTDEVADAIISNTDDIVSASTLIVNDNISARIEKSMLDTLLQNRLDSFAVDGAECESRFADTVTVEEGYYMASELDSEQTAKDIVNSLSVITEMRQVSEVIVPFTSTVQKTDEQIYGYEEVTVQGVSGVNRITQDVVLIDGQEQSRTDVSTEVIVAPVNEVVVKGTAKTLASAKQKQVAHSAGFIFPVPSGTWRVSSYYGDGRGHKGVDICAKSGTSIYAVADGKVVYSGWKGDYGYCVIIEHEGGIRTLYAHAKQLCCSVGDSVSQGEIIALVGTTGQSSGNHVHFEVIVNGRNVDPAPYINLK